MEAKIYPFTRCRTCITLRALLRYPTYQCSDCDYRMIADMERKFALRERRYWWRRLIDWLFGKEKRDA